MPVICLYFPRLKTDVAIVRHPELGSRPVVLVDRPGPEGRVTGRSTCAALLGVLPAMAAGEARGHAPSAVFLPDNSDLARKTLASIARSIRTDGAGVPEVHGDYIAVHTGKYVESERVLEAARLLGSGLAVRVGRGATVPEAFAAARSARASQFRSMPREQLRAS